MRRPGFFMVLFTLWWIIASTKKIECLGCDNEFFPQTLTANVLTTCITSPFWFHCLYSLATIEGRAVVRLSYGSALQTRKLLSGRRKGPLTSLWKSSRLYPGSQPPSSYNLQSCGVWTREIAGVTAAAAAKGGASAGVPVKTAHGDVFY